MRPLADVAEAYSRTGSAWDEGPGRLYDRLAELAVARLPRQLTSAGRVVLDVGAGTGAASRAVVRRGADAVAVDAAPGMLAHRARHRPPGAVGDAARLPFRARAFDAAVAAFSLNHLAEPAGGLREMLRVVRPGGCVVVTSYAADDGHPVKGAGEAALATRGWRPEPWYDRLRTHPTPQLATVSAAEEVARKAGVPDARCEHVAVPFPELTAADLVAWRLGMAHAAPFVAALPATERAALEAEAIGVLGSDVPELVRSMIVLTAAVPSGA